ncbi:unnamed protein product [Prunus brigantina]
MDPKPTITLLFLISPPPSSQPKDTSGLRLANPSISHGTRSPLLIPPAGGVSILLYISKNIRSSSGFIINCDIIYEVLPPILLSTPFTISHKVTGIKETSVNFVSWVTISYLYLQFLAINSYKSYINLSLTEHAH